MLNLNHSLLHMHGAIVRSVYPHCRNRYTVLVSVGQLPEIFQKQVCLTGNSCLTERAGALANAFQGPRLSIQCLRNEQRIVVRKTALH